MRTVEHISSDGFFRFLGVKRNGYGCRLAKTNLLPSFLLLLVNPVSDTGVCILAYLHRQILQQNAPEKFRV